MRRGFSRLIFFLHTMRTLSNYSLPVTITEFAKRKDRILIIRDTGGLGDILMHRMMFEDFKSLAPECQITFACPPVYHSAVKNHPFLDRIVDSKTVNENDYGQCYNTTTICGRYEAATAPECKLHRSDIWSQYCGVNLSNHDMHLQIPEQELIDAIKKLSVIGPAPYVLISPKSAIGSKDLDNKQIEKLIKLAKASEMTPFICHTTPIEGVSCQQINGLTFPEFVGFVSAAHYVVSVDTATFHLAGGLKKPLMGIFTWADGQVYGKYFDFVLVQKHRNLDKEWSCGPCYKWLKCSKCPNVSAIRKPCATEIDEKMLKTGWERLLEKFPLG